MCWGLVCSRGVRPPIPRAVLSVLSIGRQGGQIDGHHTARATPTRQALEGVAPRADPRGEDGGALRAGGPAPSAVVAGDVPDRRRLLLDPRLPAGHRRPGGRGPVTHRHAHPGAADAVRGAADVRPRGPGEPARRGLDRHAQTAAAGLAGQAVRAVPARLRRDRLHHHHHALGRRRLGARTGEPGSPLGMLAVSLLLFPKLALGLSGFETGVAVMPLVRGERGDRPEAPAAACATPAGCCWWRR